MHCRPNCIIQWSRTPVKALCIHWIVTNPLSVNVLYKTNPREQIFNVILIGKDSCRSWTLSVNTTEGRSEIHPRNNIHTNYSLFMSQDKQRVVSANVLPLTVSPCRPSHIPDYNRKGVFHKELSTIQNSKQPTSLRPNLEYFKMSYAVPTEYKWCLGT